MAKQSRLTRAAATLRKYALAYPETIEDFPWGHSAFKVKGKAFLFTSLYNEILSLSMKLPETGKVALAFPFASPTGYGLGKSGWVTARFEAEDDIPLDLLHEWIDESFRTIAPKRLVAKLPDGAPSATPPKRPKKRTQ